MLSITDPVMSKKILKNNNFKIKFRYLNASEIKIWGRLDLNQRTPKRRDLQSYEIDKTRIYKIVKDITLNYLCTFLFLIFS